MTCSDVELIVCVVPECCRVQAGSQEGLLIMVVITPVTVKRE